MNRLIAARYKPLYIFQPYSAKQQREMSKFCGFWTTRTVGAYFLDFNWEFNAGITHLS